MFSALAGCPTVFTVKLRASLIWCKQYEIATPAPTLDQLMRTSRIDGSRVGNSRWNSSLQQPIAHPAASASTALCFTSWNATHSTAPRLVNIVTSTDFSAKKRIVQNASRPSLNHDRNPESKALEHHLPAASVHDSAITPNTGKRKGYGRPFAGAQVSRGKIEPHFFIVGIRTLL